MTCSPQPDQGPDGPGPAPGTRTLRRCASDRMVAGVAGGVARYLGTDPLLVRAGFVVGSLLLGGVGGLLLYLVAWLVVPEDGRPTSIASEILGAPPWQR